MPDKTTARRVIQIVNNVIQPTTPRPKTVIARKPTDFPGIPQVYLEVALKYSSPLLLGPPLCEELLALVQHMYTEAEADLVCHLSLGGKTAAQIARSSRQPLEDVKSILYRLALDKHLIASQGPDADRKFAILPLMPGAFEMCLIRPSEDTLTDWHRRFAELFETLYETGYIMEYHRGKGVPFVRYLPVNQTIEAHQMALPTDKLEVILDRYDTFGVGICQCRVTEEAVGRGCGKPKLNCSVMGEGAKIGIKDGWLKEVTKDEMLAIKREAESHNLVNWMMNVESTKTQSSCSCCGCCCHNFRAINEFNAPSSIAPPHFLPQFNVKCIYCGKCALNCPMGALIIDTKNKTRQHLAERCIGCGLCVVACGKNQAVTMEPVPEYKMPYKSWFSLISRAAPGMLMKTWQIKRERRKV